MMKLDAIDLLCYQCSCLFKTIDWFFSGCFLSALKSRIHLQGISYYFCFFVVWTEWVSNETRAYVKISRVRYFSSTSLQNNSSISFEEDRQLWCGIWDDIPCREWVTSYSGVCKTYNRVSVIHSTRPFPWHSWENSNKNNLTCLWCISYHCVCTTLFAVTTPTLILREKCWGNLWWLSEIPVASDSSFVSNLFSELLTTSWTLHVSLTSLRNTLFFFFDAQRTLSNWSGDFFQIFLCVFRCRLHRRVGKKRRNYVLGSLAIPVLVFLQLRVSFSLGIDLSLL